MSFHRLDFTPEGRYGTLEDTPPPRTLPVMYDGEEIAVAVFDGFRYSFHLPDAIGARIDFADLNAYPVYGRFGWGWSIKPEAEDELLFILITSESNIAGRVRTTVFDRQAPLT